MIDVHAHNTWFTSFTNILEYPINAGVQSAETNISEGKLTVTGTVSGEKIVKYIHRRTGKLATIAPPPPPPKEEEKKEEEGEKKAEEKKEDKAEEKKEDKGEGDKKDDGGKEEKTTEEGIVVANGVPPEDVMKRMVYWNGGYNNYVGYNPEEEMMRSRMMIMQPYHEEEEMRRRMMMQWMPPPPPPPMYYVMNGPPHAPQIFSDENPNACCIT